MSHFPPFNFLKIKLETISVIHIFGVFKHRFNISTRLVCHFDIKFWYFSETSYHFVFLTFYHSVFLNFNIFSTRHEHIKELILNLSGTFSFVFCFIIWYISNLSKALPDPDKMDETTNILLAAWIQKIWKENTMFHVPKTVRSI